jgi:hypothetical protein
VIDIAYFQNLLLIVCIMAFIGGVFSAVVCESGIRWLHIVIKLFFSALAILGGMGAVLLVLLK